MTTEYAYARLDALALRKVDSPSGSSVFAVAQKPPLAQ
jgi:hypothetical protein